MTIILALALPGAVFSLCFDAFAAPRVVFVSDKGSDSAAGDSAHPVQTLSKAVRLLEDGGTVVIMGALSVKSAAELPSHKGTIIYTSVYDGVDYRTESTDPALVTMSANLAFGGDFVIRDVAFKATAENIVFICNSYNAVFDTGITTVKSGSGTYLSITGGGASRFVRGGSNLTVNSGTWLRLRGGNRTEGGEVAGDSRITINGGSFSSVVEGGGNSRQTGNINLTINGGTFTSVYGNYSAELNGNLFMYINGGTFSSLSIAGTGRVTGDAKLYVSPSYSLSKNINGAKGLAASSTAYAAENHIRYLTNFTSEETLTSGQLDEIFARNKEDYDSIQKAAEQEAARALEKAGERERAAPSGFLSGAALEFEVLADKKSYKKGENISLSITITNTGAYSAGDIAVKSALPCLEIESIREIGSIAPGETRTAELGGVYSSAGKGSGGGAENLLVWGFAGGSLICLALAFLFFFKFGQQRAALILTAASVALVGGLTFAAIKKHSANILKISDIASGLTLSYTGEDKGWSIYGADVDLRDGVFSSCGTAYLFSAAEAEDDLIFSGKIKLKRDGVGGVFFKCGAEEANGEILINGYYFEIDSALGCVSFYTYTKDGRRELYGRRSVSFAPEEWYEVKITCEGPYIECYFNNNPLDNEPYPKFSLSLTTRKAASVGLYFGAGSAQFKEVTIGKYENTYKGKTYQNPVMPSFTDPDIFYWEGTYYMYGARTGNTDNLYCYTSTDCVTWKDAGMVMNKNDVFGESVFKACNIVYYDGYFYMFYMANPASGDAVTSCAYAKSPLGPFKSDTKRPLSEKIEQIGGQPFADEDGRVYLTVVRYDSGNLLWVVEIKLKDGVVTLLEDTATLAIKPEEEWENAVASVTECGYIIKHKGLYYMLYAGGNYNSAYGMGYAIAQSPLGPYTKYRYNPVLKSNMSAYGVGAASVFLSPDGSEYFITYIRHTSPASVRPLNTCIDRIKFVPDPEGGPDILEVYGPTSTPQPVPSANAEKARTITELSRFNTEK